MRLILTLYLVLFLTSSAFCSIDIEDVTFGFNDGYKQGKWVPLSVLVRSQNELTTFKGELRVEVRNLFSDDPLYKYATPLQLSKTDRKQTKLNIYCPKTTIKLSIHLVRTKANGSELETINSKPIKTQEFFPSTPIENKDYFLLALTPNGDKLERLIDEKQLNDDTGIHVQYLPNTNAMPMKWIGYNSVDVFVIREVSLTERRVSKQQQTALLEWVQSGGTLVFSGGSNFRYLKGSFIEDLLPVELIGEETFTNISSILELHFGINTETKTSVSNISDNSVTKFKSIYFEPKSGCDTLISSEDRILIARRYFGNGQIICFSFDYNAPPFSDVHEGEMFWRWFLKTYGKSPIFHSDKYALFRQHEDKLQKQFMSKMPTQVPLIKSLAIILPIYLLCLGGLHLFLGKRSLSPQNRNRIFWIGGIIFVLVSITAITVGRAILPKKIQTDRLSILSIYAEQDKAKLQSFVSLRTTARINTSIKLAQDTFIRPLKTEESTNSPEFFQGSPFQLQEVLIEPWKPTTFVYKSIIPLNLKWSQVQIENTWRIIGDQATYIGNATLGSRETWNTESLSETVTKIPSNQGLNGIRKAFAHILQSEGLLQYLIYSNSHTPIDSTQNRPVLIGWMSGLNKLLSMNPLMSSQNISSNNETLVIMYLKNTNIQL